MSRGFQFNFKRLPPSLRVTNRNLPTLHPLLRIISISITSNLRVTSRSCRLFTKHKNLALTLRTVSNYEHQQDGRSNLPFRQNHHFVHCLSRDRKSGYKVTIRNALYRHTDTRNVRKHPHLHDGQFCKPLCKVLHIIFRVAHNLSTYDLVHTRARFSKITILKRPDVRMFSTLQSISRHLVSAETLYASRINSISE